MHKVLSPVPGSVWIHCVGIGQKVNAGTVLLILEIMKTEFPIETEVTGEVIMLADVAREVKQGDVIAIVREG